MEGGDEEEGLCGDGGASVGADEGELRGASLWSFMCLRDYSGGLDRRANGPSAVGTLLPLSSV